MPRRSRIHMMRELEGARCVIQTFRHSTRAYGLPEARRFAAPLERESHARQPPNEVMSSAPSVAYASQRKPLTVRPSASVTVPMPSGGGMAATNDRAD